MASKSIVRSDTKAIENPFKKSLVKTRCGSVEKRWENILSGCEIEQKLEREMFENEKNHEIQIFSEKNIFLASQGFNFKWKLKASDNNVFV